MKKITLIVASLSLALCFSCASAMEKKPHKNSAIKNLIQKDVASNSNLKVLDHYIDNSQNQPILYQLNVLEISQDIRKQINNIFAQNNFNILSNAEFDSLIKKLNENMKYIFQNTYKLNGRFNQDDLYETFALLDNRLTVFEASVYFDIFEEALEVPKDDTINTNIKKVVLTPELDSFTLLLEDELKYMNKASEEYGDSNVFVSNSYDEDEDNEDENGVIRKLNALKKITLSNAEKDNIKNAFKTTLNIEDLSEKEIKKEI